VAAAGVQLAGEASILRFLAALGMTTAEFSHETGMKFDAFRLDFERVFDAAKMARPDDERLIAQAARANGMLARLDTLTSYLNALAGARAARGMHPISVSKAVQDFDRGMRAQAESQRISLKVIAPPYDPLFTRPMHEAEVGRALESSGRDQPAVARYQAFLQTVESQDGREVAEIRRMIAVLQRNERYSFTWTLQAARGVLPFPAQQHAC
jgi:hypothetical protein